MNLETLVQILLAAPLLAFIILVLGRTTFQRTVASTISLIASFLSLAISSWLCFRAFIFQQQLAGSNHLWFSVGEQNVYYGFTLEPLQLIMLFLVSLVSFFVQLYSVEYMKEDSRIPVYFGYLSFFTFSMLGLVLSPNLLQIYFFWELVGVSSFLLIGFWYYKEEAKQAARKAFIITRIGDVGLFIALGLLFWQVGSFELQTIFHAVSIEGTLEPGMVTLIGLSLFIAAIGKSGQLPLHTWLPDAMEGPTPVSALIHAATMVAAGVYLVALTFPIFEASPVALDVVAYVGAVTALFAAVVAIGQNDLKRILAYSTISQLGLMMLALGSGEWIAGTFHLFTHGFFKALLFLAAGAVILLYHRQQDIGKMGGLWKKEKTVSISFLIGALAIAGVPPLSGFFSKEEILASVYQSDNIFLFGLALLVSLLTSLYMFRLFFVVFTGEEKQSDYGKVGWIAKLPLYLLALLAIFSGFVQYPGASYANFLSPGEEHLSIPLWISFLSILASGLGILIAYLFYGKKSQAPDRVAQFAPALTRLVKRKFYVDEMYLAIFVYPLKALGWLLNGLDRFVIGGVAKGVSWSMHAFGRLGSRLQNGQVQRYLIVSLLGMIVIFLGLAAGRLLP